MILTNMREELTPYQMELLGVLQEECAEVIQIISKIRRFGINSWNPSDDGNPSNHELLNLEVADVLGVIALIKESKNTPLDDELIENRANYKMLKVHRYMRPELLAD